MVNYRPRDSLSEGRGGDRSKDSNLDYMVDCRPGDSLSEGRGW
jgi:hypothetical protein